MWDSSKIFAALSASSLCISTGGACGIFTGVVAGSRKEAWASEARGESKSTDWDATGFTGARITGTSGMVLIGATGRTGTTGRSGVAEGKLSGASGSKDEDKVDERGATGA